MRQTYAFEHSEWMKPHVAGMEAARLAGTWPMNIGERNQIQGFSGRNQGEHDYMQWQNIIEDSCGVKSTVVVMDKVISIRTDSYADYLLARSVVSKRTGMEIVRG